jgi:hypothetical protein
VKRGLGGPTFMARHTGDAVQAARPIEYWAWIRQQMAWDRKTLLNMTITDRIDLHARNQAWAFQEEINARHRERE